MSTSLFDPKMDFVFKNIFGSEKNSEILMSFLNGCIKSKNPIVEVQIKSSELPKKYIEDNFFRVEILAKTKAGETLNIELQFTDEKNMAKRSLYYWSKAYTNEYFGKGRYSALPRTICINVIDFELLKEENYHNVYVLRNTENSNILTDVIEIHFIELPKMKKLDENDLLSIWTAFINDPNDEKVIELETSYSELHEAKIELARLSRDPKEAENYRQRQNAMSDKSNALLEAEDKGIKLGEKNAQNKMAKKMLQKEYSMEEIIDNTGLTEEEILNLKKEQNTKD